MSAVLTVIFIKRLVYIGIYAGIGHNTTACLSASIPSGNETSDTSIRPNSLLSIIMKISPSSFLSAYLSFSAAAFLSAMRF